MLNYIAIYSHSITFHYWRHSVTFISPTPFFEFFLNLGWGWSQLPTVLICYPLIFSSLNVIVFFFNYTLIQMLSWLYTIFIRQCLKSSPRSHFIKDVLNNNVGEHTLVLVPFHVFYTNGGKTSHIWKVSKSSHKLNISEKRHTMKLKNTHSSFSVKH